MSASWDLVISEADWTKLQAGLWPRDMDDRWIYEVDEPDVSGVITIHIKRSWTGIELYAMHIKPKTGQSDSSEASGDNDPTTIIAITWEQNKNGILITEEQAKIEVTILTRNLLDCDFDQLPFYDNDLMWNHPNMSLGKNINRKHTGTHPDSDTDEDEDE